MGQNEVHDQYYYAQKFKESHIIEKPKKVNIVFREQIIFHTKESDSLFQKTINLSTLTGDVPSGTGEILESIPVDNKYIYIFKTAKPGETPKDGIPVLKYAEIAGKCSSVESTVNNPEVLINIREDFRRGILGKIRGIYGCPNVLSVEPIVLSKFAEYSKKPSFKRGYIRKNCFNSLKVSKGVFGVCSDRSDDKKPKISYEKKYVTVEIGGGSRCFVVMTNDFLPLRRIRDIRSSIAEGIKNGTLSSGGDFDIDEITESKLISDRNNSPDGAKTFLLVDYLSEIEFLYSYFKMYRDTVMRYIEAYFEPYQNEDGIEELALEQLVFQILDNYKNEVPFDSDGREVEEKYEKYEKCIKYGGRFYKIREERKLWIDKIKNVYEAYASYLSRWIRKSRGTERILDKMYYGKEGSSEYVKKFSPYYFYLLEISSSTEGVRLLLSEYEKYLKGNPKSLLKCGIELTKTANDFSVELDLIKIWAPVIAAKERQNAKRIYEKILKEIDDRYKFRFPNVDKFGIDEKTWAIVEADVRTSLSETPTTKEVSAHLRKRQAKIGGVLALMNFYVQVSDLVSGKNITNDRALGTTVSLLDVIGSISSVLNKLKFAEFIGSISAGFDSINCIMNIQKGKNHVSEYTKLIGFATLVVVPLAKRFLAMSLTVTRTTNILGWLLIITGIIIEKVNEKEEDALVWLRHCDLGICSGCKCESENWKKERDRCQTYKALRELGKKDECWPNPSDYDDWTQSYVKAKRFSGFRSIQKKLPDFIVNNNKYIWPKGPAEQKEAFSKLIIP